MGKITKKITNREENEAYNLMDTEKLVFVLRNRHDKKRLIKFVKKKNNNLYKKDEFKLIETMQDSDLIVAAVPQLGSGQVGLYAGRKFEAGEMIVAYNGEDKWGLRTNKEIKQKIENCDESGDYFWHVIGKHGGMAIDSTLKGTVARFVNDSLERNVVVEVSGNTLQYLAKRDIEFGEELTTCYGRQYFDKLNPRVEYRSTNLQRILSKLYALKSGETFSLIPIHNLDELENFLQALNWPDQTMAKFTNTYSSVQVDLMPEERDNLNTKLYLKNDKPLIIDLSKTGNFDIKRDFESSEPGGIDLLESVLNVKIQVTSRFKLFAAPTDLVDHQPRFSLFAGQYIKKNETVCFIKGEELKRKEVSSNKDLNPNLLFQINQSKFIYCANVGSEALFVHGVERENLANVRLSVKGNWASYIPTEDIDVGVEIVAFYGDGYAHPSSQLSLEQVIYNFNKNQLQWDAWLKKSQQDYTIDFFPHIMTPGRGIPLDEDSSFYYDEVDTITPTHVENDTSARLESPIASNSTKHDDTPAKINEQGSFLKPCLYVFPSAMLVQNVINLEPNLLHSQNSLQIHKKTKVPPAESADDFEIPLKKSRL